MITGIKEGQIDRSQYSHIATIYDENGRFPLANVGDFMSGGFSEFTPLGTTFSNKDKHSEKDQTYHMLVCYPVDHNDIEKITAYLTECLDKLDIPAGETIAIHIPVCYDEEPTRNHHPFSLLGAIARSKQHVVVHHGHY